MTPRGRPVLGLEGAVSDLDSGPEHALHTPNRLCVLCQEGPEGTSQTHSDTTAVTPQVPAGPDLRGATIPNALLKDARTGSAHKDLSFSWDAVSRRGIFVPSRGRTHHQR